MTEIPNKCEAKSKLLTISPASTSKGGSNRWGSGAKEAPCVNWKKKIKVKVIGQISINKKIGGINIIFSWPGALFEKKEIIFGSSSYFHWWENLFCQEL